MTDPASPPLLPREPFDSARARVNAWRGRAIQAMSQAETAVTECLLTLASVPDRGAAVSLPHLIGQRFGALATLIGAAGAFHTEAGAIEPVLGRFMDHLPLRNMLCHGVGKLSLDQSGRWTLVLCVLTLRSRKEHREVQVFAEEDAEARLKLLLRDSQVLCSRLGALRERLRPAAAGGE